MQEYSVFKENNINMETSKETPKRYHPLLVALHWLILFVLLGAGFLSEGEGRRSVIDIHMILGAVLLVLMVIRLTVRITAKRPAWADTGNKYLNWFGELTHWAMYLAIFFILGMGTWIAFSRNLVGYVLGSGAVERVPRFIGTIHHLGWFMILGLLGLHVAGVLYHEVILNDRLLGRMWFGKR